MAAALKSSYRFQLIMKCHFSISNLQHSKQRIFPVREGTPILCTCCTPESGAWHHASINSPLLAVHLQQEKLCKLPVAFPKHLHLHWRHAKILGNGWSPHEPNQLPKVMVQLCLAATIVRGVGHSSLLVRELRPTSHFSLFSCLRAIKPILHRHYKCTQELLQLLNVSYNLIFNLCLSSPFAHSHICITPGNTYFTTCHQHAHITVVRQHPHIHPRSLSQAHSARITEVPRFQSHRGQNLHNSFDADNSTLLSFPGQTLHPCKHPD